MSGYKAPCMSRKEFAPALSPEPTGRNFQISPVLSETCHRLGKILSETCISKPRRRSLRLAVTHMSHLRQTQLQWGQSHRHYLFCRHGLYFLVENRPSLVVTLVTAKERALALGGTKDAPLVMARGEAWANWG